MMMMHRASCTATWPKKYYRCNVCKIYKLREIGNVRCIAQNVWNVCKAWHERLYKVFNLFNISNCKHIFWSCELLLEHSSDDDDHDLCLMGIGKYWQLTSAPTFNKFQQTNVNDDDLWPNKQPTNSNQQLKVILSKLIVMAIVHFETFRVNIWHNRGFTAYIYDSSYPQPSTSGITPRNFHENAVNIYIHNKH